jgi:hypothetical protein
MKVILILCFVLNVSVGVLLLSMGSVFAAFSFSAAAIGAVVLRGDL